MVRNVWQVAATVWEIAYSLLTSCVGMLPPDERAFDDHPTEGKVGRGADPQIRAKEGEHHATLHVFLYYGRHFQFVSGTYLFVAPRHMSDSRPQKQIPDKEACSSCGSDSELWVLLTLSTLSTHILRPPVSEGKVVFLDIARHVRKSPCFLMLQFATGYPCAPLVRDARPSWSTVVVSRHSPRLPHRSTKRAQHRHRRH